MNDAGPRSASVVFQTGARFASARRAQFPGWSFLLPSCSEVHCKKVETRKAGCRRGYGEGPAVRGCSQSQCAVECALRTMVARRQRKGLCRSQRCPSPHQQLQRGGPQRRERALGARVSIAPRNGNRLRTKQCAVTRRDDPAVTVIIVCHFGVQPSTVTPTPKSRQSMAATLRPKPSKPPEVRVR